MDDLGDTLARLRGAWMAGGSARAHCPADWLPLVGEGAGAEAALAALAGHALQVAFRPAPGGVLAARDPLPALALPPLATALRPRARRLIAGHAWLLRHLLLFLAMRGVSMHPADWLPGKRSEAVPALYAPWVDWVNGPAPEKPAAKPREVDVAALAAELAAMLAFETTGLIRRRKRLKIDKLKTTPQMARRQDLFGSVPLAALAAALGVTPGELVQTAPTGIEHGIAAFAAMVAASGTPDECRKLLAAMLDDTECPLAGAVVLAATLDAGQATDLLPAMLRREEAADFRRAIELAGGALGGATWAQVAAAPGYQRLGEILKDGEADARAKTTLAAGLAALGLLADGACAQAVVQTCLAAGMSPADPKLDALQLNIALAAEVSA